MPRAHKPTRASRAWNEQLHAAGPTVRETPKQRHERIVQEMSSSSTAIAVGLCPQCGGSLNACDCGFRLQTVPPKPWDQTVPYYRRPHKERQHAGQG